MTKHENRFHTHGRTFYTLQEMIDYNLAWMDRKVDNESFNELWERFRIDCVTNFSMYEGNFTNDDLEILLSETFMSFMKNLRYMITNKLDKDE